MPTSTQPNILVFFTDQQRWDTCGCYGQPLEVTPNLDRMAAEGKRFAYAFTPQPVCGPARACLQTGKYPAEIGCFINGKALPAEETTLAQRLGEAGYETAYIGKWHLASDAGHRYETSPVPPARRGGYTDYWLASDVLEFTSHSYDGHMFDAAGTRREFPPDRYRVDVLTDWALEYLANRQATRPFFLFLSFIEPHFQNDHHCFEGPRGSRERFHDYVTPGDLLGTEGDWRENYPDYLGCCASLDENLGRIRRELKRLGQAENTVILFTSDHGCHFCTRNSEYKRDCHDGSLRIPLVACGPGFTGGQVIDSHPVSLIDVPPTLLAAAGLDTPPEMRGHPLQQLLRGPAEDWPAEVFAQISEDHIGRTIRTNRWKYTVWVPADTPWSGWQAPGSETYTEKCLHDLDVDPHERENLITHPAYAGIRLELCERLQRRMVEAGEAPPLILPATCASPCL